MMYMSIIHTIKYIMYIDLYIYDISTPIYCIADVTGKLL